MLHIVGSTPIRGQDACVFEQDTLSHTAHHRGVGLCLALGLVIPPNSICTVQRSVGHASCFSVRGWFPRFYLPLAAPSTLSGLGLVVGELHRQEIKLYVPCHQGYQG